MTEVWNILLGNMETVDFRGTEEDVETFRKNASKRTRRVCHKWRKTNQTIVDQLIEEQVDHIKKGSAIPLELLKELKKAKRCEI